MSHTSAFKGKKIAVMVASGFNEEQFIILQKTKQFYKLKREILGK